MNENHKELISIGLTISIVALALFIVHRFIPSILWAAIITIATYPLYRRWKRLFWGNENWSALLFTILLGLLLLLPLSWLVSILVKELQFFINYLHTINRVGGQAPEIFHHIPGIGNELIAYWDSNIGQPGSLKYLLSNLHLSLTPASYYIKQVGVNLAHRGFQLGFTLLTLFFFYRDGDKLFQQINHIGEYCLGPRWFRYSDRLPSALRSTVNGTILVGLGVGFLMGIAYVLVGFPAPTLLGFITAFAAMIPFVVPLVFAIVALILLASGSMVGAIIVVVWGTLVMFVADHFVKPVLIGGAIQLPFLPVLFGILGGLETLGILGLFIGPMIMVLFITLWQEPQRV
ncbi:AI-2E family transporter [Legionella spiritensis]|uniref:Transmembrane permease n=1 Tax=Legionella spiritensis TaxID=452 RepID=A0A0W0YXQ0_LEGSP|nr:AI-2E family transporter [Legionella spiritensis]KTD61363.1 transmembrane permease [Legionella spiritensis]SNV33755.1 transmembrane permease [Legionella spiritensis]